MQQEDYIQYLESGIPSQVRAALESGCIPKSQRGVQALVKAITPANTYFQSLAANTAKQLENEYKVLVLARLAQYGVTPEIRHRAVEGLLQINTEDAQEALVACVMDQEVQIQQKALVGLKGYTKQHAIDVLIDRLEHPEAAIPPNQHGMNPNDIRGWAIQGLATKGASRAVAPLVKYMVAEPSLRSAIIATLITIDSSAVVTALLKMVEEEENGDGKIDQQLCLDATKVIAEFSGKLSKRQAQDYRRLLAKMFPVACQQVHRDRYVLTKTAEHLDTPELAEVVRAELQRQLPRGQAQEIIRQLGIGNVLAHVPYWRLENEIFSYLTTLWSQANRGQKISIVNTLGDGPPDDESAVTQTGKFLAAHWEESMQDEDENLVLDVVISAWEAATPIQQEAIENIFELAGESVPDKNQWVKALAERAPSDPQDKRWSLLEKGFACLPLESRAGLFQLQLKNSWNQRLVERVLEADPDNAAQLLRTHLWERGLTGNDRKWALLALGNCGAVDDFTRLSDEIEGKSQKNAVAAVQAIGRIDPNRGQGILSETLSSRKRGAVMAALTMLGNVTRLDVTTVRALRMRAEPTERDAEVRQRAISVLGTLKEDFIDNAPSSSAQFAVIQKWVETLAAFEKDDQTCTAIQQLLSDLGDREAPDVRILIAENIASCCPAEEALKIAEREAELERRPAVQAAWSSALDEIRGLPDRGVLHLIERVCDIDLDRQALLGSWLLSDLLVEPELTLNGLNWNLKRAEKVKQDPDSLIAQLDSIANLLVDEVFLVEGDEISRFSNKYGNEIGALRKLNPRIYHHAHTLHSLREVALGPHAKDSSGKLRPGANPSEAESAKQIFVALFQEVVNHLRSKKEEDKAVL